MKLIDAGKDNCKEPVALLSQMLKNDIDFILVLDERSSYEKCKNFLNFKGINYIVSIFSNNEYRIIVKN